MTGLVALENQCKFLALGGVWLDDIISGDDDVLTRAASTLRKDVVGGSVIFATLGARLFAERSPHTICLVAVLGHDFPPCKIDVWRAWDIDITVHWARDSPAARGIVVYSDANGSARTYQRVTDPLQTHAAQHLTQTNVSNTKAFHFFDVPEEVQRQIEVIHSMRNQESEPTLPSTIYIWEPQAKNCLPARFTAHIRALKHVDVFSPNHMELMGLLLDKVDLQTWLFSKPAIEAAAQRVFLDAVQVRGNHDRLTIVVRCAEHGCFVLPASGTSIALKDIAGQWLPAFYHDNQEKIVDPTGAGNAFLGALAIGYQETGGDVVEAAKYGQIAASFVIEQIGFPVLERSTSAAATVETWNGQSVRDRLAQYDERLRYGI